MDSFIRVREMQAGEEAQASEALFTAFYERGVMTIWANPDPIKRAEALRKVLSTRLVEASDASGGWVEVAITNSLRSEEATEKGSLLGGFGFAGAAVWQFKRLVDAAHSGAPGPPPSAPLFRPEVLALLDCVNATSPPLPYVYLALLGVPESGRGIGSALLKAGLASAATRYPGLRVALWTDSEVNVAFYEKFGFVKYCFISESMPQSPSCWWMVRDHYLQ